MIRVTSLNYLPRKLPENEVWKIVGIKFGLNDYMNCKYILIEQNNDKENNIQSIWSPKFDY